MKKSSVVTVLVPLMLGGCSAILGIDDLPYDGLGSDASTSVEAGLEASAADGSTSTTHDASNDAEAALDGSADTGAGDASHGTDARASDASEAGDSSLGCDAGLTVCGTTCVDLQTSTSNCGSCNNACATVTGATTTCEAAVCKLDSDESINKDWSFAAPGPYLSFWKDGTLLASSGSATVLISGGANPSKTDFQALPGRQTNVIPNVPTRTEVTVAHYGSFDGRTESNVQAWTNGIHGCCAAGPDGFAVDPVMGRLFSGHGVTELNTDDGTTVSATNTSDQHGSPFSITSSALYLPRLNTPNVEKYDRGHALQWTLQMGPTGTALVGVAIIAADGGVIVTSPAGGYLSRLKPTGSKAWEVPVDSPGLPITTSDGLIVLGANVSNNPNLCALDYATGATSWCTPTSAAVVDVLSGDDGILYVAVASTPTVYGYDRGTGALRYTFRNVPTPGEMLLRNGHLYVYGASTVTSLAVPAGKYDASSWPVRFHDNQRTRGTIATLDY